MPHRATRPHSSVVQRENDAGTRSASTIWTLQPQRRPSPTRRSHRRRRPVGTVLANRRPVAFEARAPEHETLGQLIYTRAHLRPIPRGASVTGHPALAGRPGRVSLPRPAGRPPPWRGRRLSVESKVYESCHPGSRRWRIVGESQAPPVHPRVGRLLPQTRRDRSGPRRPLGDITDRDRTHCPGTGNGDGDLGLSRALTLIDRRAALSSGRGEAVVPGASAVDALFARAS